MDLPAEALRLRLDVLAVDVCDSLRAAGVPHALIKGPSTARWLYDPPRPYRDVDILLPESAVPDACEALERAGLARRISQRIGEEAAHSVILRSADGAEIDLHVTLPTVPRAGDRCWSVLREHVALLELDVGSVPALDEVGRCLVLALHALNNGPGSGQPLDDLRLARERSGPETWSRARAVAERLDAGDLFAGALALLAEPAEPAQPLTRRAQLYAGGPPNVAVGLERLAEARWWQRPVVLWREIVPSRGFMRYANPGLPDTRRAMVRAHLRRWLRLLRQLPAGVHYWRAIRRR